MKLLILAAGYATRLYPLTLKTAKPLLPVVGRPMIEHILEKFGTAADIAHIVMNEKFHGDFDQVRKKYNSIQADSNNRVTAFVEKDPNADSTITAICLYYFPRATLSLVGRYLAENPGATDYPGRYIQWLYRQRPPGMMNF